MERRHISEFKGGWILGNFSPAVVATDDFEFGVKNFDAGFREPSHYQVVATEVTYVVSGKVRLAGETFVQGEICVIYPTEIADFEALERSVVAVVKFPSLPDDKILVK